MRTKHTTFLWPASELAGASFFTLGLLAGCATPTPGAQPEDMSAAEHRAAAEAELAKRQRHGDEYDPAASAGAPSVAANLGDTDVSSFGTYNPTAAHAAEAAEHKRHAADHQAAARALEQFEDSACHAFQPETRALCPLMGQTLSVEETAKGARVTLNKTADAAAVEAHISCHLAYAQTQGREGMETCPLYIKAITVTSAGPGILEFQTEDVSRREELRKRLADHVGHNE